MTNQIYFFIFQTIELRLPFSLYRTKGFESKPTITDLSALYRIRKDLHINDISNSVSVSKNVICLLQ